MYVAYATSARSLAPGRHVGAALVKSSSIIATGFNEVPGVEFPDVMTGIDASELYKRGLVTDTIVRIKPMLAEKYRESDDLALAEALELLQGSEVLSVIEGQRAVHAEASAIGDAAKRGIPIVGADLYVTTYPCHLCFKAAIDAGVDHVYYIDPYPKSRAAAMYPGSTHKLVPYVGLAPRLFMRVFKNRPVAQPDSEGRFSLGEVRLGRPFLARNDRSGLIAKREKEAMAQELVGVTRS
jgi:cytidine deaminase